jgi:hypothetical protein
MHRPPLGTRIGMAQGELNKALLARTMKGVRLGLAHQSDPELDDFLIDLIGGGRLGFGF